ncbi:hypothetical protein SAMN05878276_3456 [Aquipseudomonas alcaligenes]|nr:hypothetical protein SAMN05878276_3456 [Pseudomonas alcaligenes]
MLPFISLNEYLALIGLAIGMLLLARLAYGDSPAER